MSISSAKILSAERTACFHCGLPCPDDRFRIEDKLFCCRGCEAVYRLLSENQLCDYYELNARPGISLQDSPQQAQFAFLDDRDTQLKLMNFSDGKTGRITFSLPQIHCSSCIWLLENLHRINSGIQRSQTDFIRKTVSLQFDEEKISLRETAELLSHLGYTPALSLQSLSGEKEVTAGNERLYMQLGVAGFAFGNIMLMSFPEYFGLEGLFNDGFRRFFGFLNLLLAVPVLLFSAKDYLTSAWHGLRHRHINIDVPLSLGMLALFARSVYEILSGTGAGYMDSFTGLIFFLLLGRLFQQKSYQQLAFDRDYTSFFPVSVTALREDKEVSIPLSRLTVGQRIIIRNRELIPADAVLISGNAEIDYSFVTGESQPVRRSEGEHIFAGGRQSGAAIIVEVIKPVSQSYLTRLWADETFNNDTRQPITAFANTAARYFTLAILVIAAATALYWLPSFPSTAINAFTAVLIIACPCALALSAPFTFGNVMRLLGRHGFFLRQAESVEILAAIRNIIFDKTGTLTLAQPGEIVFQAADQQPELSDDEKALIGTITHHSSHPYSQQISASLPQAQDLVVENFAELEHQGIYGDINHRHLRLGTFRFASPGESFTVEPEGSLVHLSIDNIYRGFFVLRQPLRTGLAALIKKLQQHYRLALLSGDGPSARQRFRELFGNNTRLHFRQSPHDKLAFVKRWQAEHGLTMMIGDGLNDAGALRQSDAGISVADNLNNFTPASDAILAGSAFDKLPDFLRFSQIARRIIYFNLAISILYNIVGLTFAVTGQLSPVICAILMPLSSITVIASSTGLTHWFAWRLGINPFVNQEEQRK